MCLRTQVHTINISYLVLSSWKQTTNVTASPSVISQYATAHCRLSILFYKCRLNNLNHFYFLIPTGMVSKCNCAENAGFIKSFRKFICWSSYENFQNGFGLQDLNMTSSAAVTGNVFIHYNQGKLQSVFCGSAASSFFLLFIRCFNVFIADCCDEGVRVQIIYTSLVLFDLNKQWKHKNV